MRLHLLPGIVYNSTGEQTCFDLYSLYVECADPTGCGLGFNSYAWDYQVLNFDIGLSGHICTHLCSNLFTFWLQIQDLGHLSCCVDQACTEIEMCFESNNVTDMFPPMPFTQSMREEYCSKRWAVLPRPGWLKTQYWGDGEHPTHSSGYI